MNSSEAYQMVQALDLDPIKFKLMHKESGEGWSYQKAGAVEFEYRRFLYLIKMYPNETVAPVEDVDTFWHYHILDTMKYAADCEAVFGYFVHHYPYAGMADEQDREAMAENAERSRALYDVTFAAGAPGDGGVSRHDAGPGGATAASVTARSADSILLGKRTDRDDTGKPAYCVKAQGREESSASSAYCVVAAKPSYCVVSSKPAYCVVSSKPAYCVVAGKPAYCVVSSKPAYCVVSSKPAYCVVSGKPAYCVVSSKPAYCVVSSKPAYCVKAKPAYCVVQSSHTRSEERVAATALELEAA